MLLPLSIRALTLSVIVLLTDYFLPLGTSPLVLALSCSLGALVSGYAARSRLKTFGFLTALAVLIAFATILSKASEIFLIGFVSDPLLLHALQLHGGMNVLTFVLGALSTWFVMRSVHGLSLEVTAIVCSALYLFSGHREFNFQSPQILGTLAWSLGYSPLAVLSALGISLLLLTLLYVRLGGGLHEKRLNLRRHSEDRSSRSSIRGTLSLVCVLGLFSLIGNIIFSHFKTEAEIRTSNGVGQGKKEDRSPLGFNSALGASNQPAALVRLDSDYSNNPFVPMLYMRETVLSEYNGVEMVAADARYDRETATIVPGDHYKNDNAPDWDYRTPLVQSVFLLSEHKLAFSVDYPISINPLKNPNPDRFRAAYKAYSMAPAFDQQSLESLGVGDPSWDDTTRAHYLKTNPDGRYTELAKKVTVNIESPIAQAFALTNYLSEKTTYTLSPGHEVPENGDQTAPYLFGDFRGYCVHFAHALAYLFRSLGIPARVATGYLTDLSEARDGHILLRMSDRHAWAEVFVTGRGWIPFDPKPQNVESNAESPVDMKLLEELMGLVGPDEEILPTDLTKGDAGVTEPSAFPLPGRKAIAIPLGAMLATIIGVKLLLWFAWMLPGSKQQQLRRLYRSIVARVNDLGISREEGETRQEFRNRVTALLGKDLLGLTVPLTEMTYAGKLQAENLRSMYQSDVESLARVPTWQRIRAIFSIQSVLRFCTKERW